MLKKFFAAGLMVIFNATLLSLILTPALTLSPTTADFVKWLFVSMGIVTVIAGGFSVSPLGDAIVRWAFASSARPPNEEENKTLRPIIAKLTRLFGVKNEVNFWIIDTEVVNAFALGRRTVVVTQGLLQIAGPGDEKSVLQGILAHELGHLQRGDTILMSACSIMALIGQLSFKLLNLTLICAERLARYTGFNAIRLLILAILKPLQILVAALQKVLQLCLLAVCRANEFDADQYAVRAGAGEGLLLFLQAAAESQPPAKGNLKTILEATHPDAGDRIAKVTELMRQEAAPLKLVL